VRARKPIEMNSPPTNDPNDPTLGKAILGALVLGLFLWLGYLAVYGVARALHYLVYQDSPSATEEMVQELASYACQLAAPVFDSILISKRMRFDSNEAERRAKIWVNRFPETVEKFPEHVREFRFIVGDQSIMNIAESRAMWFLENTFSDRSGLADSIKDETVSAGLRARAECLEDVRAGIRGQVRIRTWFDEFVEK